MSIFEKIGNAVFGPDNEIEEPEITKPAAAAEQSAPKAESKRNKVISINTTTQMQVVVIKINHFEEAREIVDQLKSKKPVVINLETLEKDTARRVVDVISGAVYALDGSIQKVSSGIFLIAPYNVGIMGDVKDELKNNALFAGLL